MFKIKKIEKYIIIGSVLYEILHKKCLQTSYLRFDLKTFKHFHTSQLNRMVITYSICISLFIRSRLQMVYTIMMHQFQSVDN